MARFSMFLLFAVVTTSMFVIKNNVISLESDLQQINAQIQSDQKAIHVLKAEWTHLNDPERIRVLSTTHAKMKPLRGEQIISFASIPFKAEETLKTKGIIQVSYNPLAKE